MLTDGIIVEYVELLSTEGTGFLTVGDTVCTDLEGPLLPMESTDCFAECDAEALRSARSVGEGCRLLVDARLRKRPEEMMMLLLLESRIAILSTPVPEDLSPALPATDVETVSVVNGDEESPPRLGG